MRLAMNEKQTVKKQLAVKYKQADMKQEAKILEPAIERTRSTFSYVARVLRKPAKPKVVSRSWCAGMAHGQRRMDGSPQAAEAMTIDWFRELKIVNLVERYAVLQQ